MSMSKAKKSFSAKDEARRDIILWLVNLATADTLPRSVADDLVVLWRHPDVQACADRSSPTSSLKHARYFLDSIDRIADPKYIPTDADLLHLHVSQPGAFATTLREGELSYRFWDVRQPGGMRRKWTHMFEDMAVIVFVVSLAAYDQPFDKSDEGCNMMHSMNEPIIESAPYS
jgi:guanine nucleotide-binding protein G(i) subunit alpha